jgi:hypothetical protein
MIQPDQQDIGLGALAAALAKAQAAFPAIVRDKEVDSRSYKFKYAPLDKIIEGVRPALTDNGLAFTQLLDGPDLVTMLLHESGATLAGRMPLPRGNGETIQQLGSAITYLRRYALQAMLGIAAEEDDDGEAAGKLRTRRESREERDAMADAAIDRMGIKTGPATSAFTTSDAHDSGLIGTAETGKGDADFEIRQTPTGHKLAFRLVEGRKGIKVIALDSLAEQIAEYRAGIEGYRVTCWGRLTDQTFTPKPKDENDHPRPVTYQVLTLSRLKVGQLELAESTDLVATAQELFPDAVMA